MGSTCVAFLRNIKLKKVEVTDMTLTNTQAYYGAESITTVKSFIVLAPVLHEYNHSRWGRLIRHYKFVNY
jgi:hypothetical protein